MAFSGVVYPRETLIDLVENQFRSVAQRRHRQTMGAAWTAMALSLLISLTSSLLTVYCLLSTNGIKATGFQPVRFSVMYYNLPSHF